MSNTDTFEHLEDMPDQDEIGIQRTADYQGGTLPEPDRSPEVRQIASERNEIVAAARQLAAALDRSGTPATKVLTVASQAIFRSMPLNDATPQVCAKLVSDHSQRASIKIMVLVANAANASVFLSPFMLGDIPNQMSCPPSAIKLPANTWFEIRTTSELWVRLAEDSSENVVINTVEEFVS